MIYLRNNHLNLSMLIRKTNALYMAYEIIIIITATKGVGEEEGAGEEIAILLISLSLSFLRLIRCIFDR
jgi:hypothetical protein